MFRSSFVLWLALSSAVFAVEPTGLRLATFSEDITIPLGHRCMGILPTKALRIEDPLEARGMVLLGAGKPVVLVALDWCEVRNGAYDQWRDQLAEAAGTVRNRVLVCALHQHDAPVTDSGAQALLDSVGLQGELYDVAFHADCIARVAEAVRKAIAVAQPLTHVAASQAKVDRIASTRRVEYPDGRVGYDRGSSMRPDSPQVKADEGAIDPFLKSIHFYNKDRELAVLTSYATHPMSYYGRGGVTADFVGMARRRRQVETDGSMQIYMTGCSGDVTAGKYNDGAPATRGILADRLYQAMVAAAAEAQPQPISEYGFRCETFQLPFHEGEEFSRDAMTAMLRDDNASQRDRILAAMGLSSLNRIESGQPIDLPCLDLGIAQIVLMPGESFVEYQLMAQRLRPDSFVMAVGFGESWTGYIPTKQAFDEGFGHSWRWVGRGCEAIIREKLTRVLAE
ncbi:hypothetical protein EC9_16250 [Rosistilla ulvae]|uniref:Neutral/alkaline non-lysosomal ceramidase n=1 Tax=Rosistilla ulvae TaxID=1930277 RepID=A0A517LXV6_9BACT|nr:hypothetical protein [Rosistilla ulvae]QDS87447.1 hypothetical protein EC9_16250 [Rosistilla ulvae]